VRPEVSVIMATGGRGAFLAQAVRCWRRQTFTASELVIADHGMDDGVVPRDPRIRRLQVEPGTTQGEKLNRAAQAARGALLQKMDDDDWYHPRFLEAMVAAVRRAGRPAVAGMGRFLALIAETGALKDSGPGWCAGGTLCFGRALWERAPFRDVAAKTDYWFMKDWGGEPVRVDRRELYILVRHGRGHAWTRMGETDVTGWFARRPDHGRTLAEVVPAPEDRAFYASLRAKGAPRGAPALHR
jgi:glycosyltransferase involved in cell wall biosynthesis